MLEGCNIGLRPNGEQVSGATPNMREQFPSGCRAPGLIQSRQQAVLDLATLRRWYQSGALVGGLYLPDWAYQAQDSVGTPVTAAGQVVGLWRDATWDGALGLETLAGPELNSNTGWSLTAQASISEGALHVVSSDGSFQYGRYDNAFQAGKTYLIEIVVTRVGAGAIKIGDGYVSISNAISSTGTYFCVYYAAYTNIYIQRSSGVTDVDVSRVSVKQLLGNHAAQTTTANKPLSARTSVTNKNWLNADSTDVLPVVFPSALGSACTIARATPSGPVYSESQTISTTWNGLISPYQYNSAVLVANRALSASEKAVVSRVLGRYVPVLGYSYPFAIAQTGGGTVDLKIKTTGATPVFIDWGDGAISVVASNTTETHVYSGTYSGNVRVSSESFITEWTSTNGKWNFTGSDLPSGMTYFVCGGSNTLSGTLSLPSGMTYFVCTGTNTLSGTLSLPSTLTYFRCEGSNTLSGTLSLPSTLTYFLCTGSNTLSGTLSLPSGMTYFACGGSNTLSGTLSLPSGMTYFVCGGSNTLSGYTSSAKASNQQRFYHIPVAPGGLSSAQVDQLLIDYAAAGGSWTAEKQVYIKGTNAARTSASDAAVATLQGKGVTVTTN